jgi:hypothetical protein
MTVNMDIHDGNNSQLSLIRRGVNDGGLTVNYSIGSEDTTFSPHGLQSTTNIMAAPNAYEGQLDGLAMKNFSIRIDSKTPRDINATVPPCHYFSILCFLTSMLSLVVSKISVFIFIVKHFYFSSTTVFVLKLTVK